MGRVCGDNFVGIRKNEVGGGWSQSEKARVLAVKPYEQDSIEPVHPPFEREGEMFRKCHVRYYKFMGTGIEPYHEADGLFHQWAQQAWEESFSYTVGIVELEDGTIVTAEPVDIKFIK